MSIWVLRQFLTEREEAQIRQRDALALPFGDVPDLSMLANPGECRRLLQALHPHDPPEAIARKVERIWKLYGEIAPEDIIAVPLRHRREIALAEIAGRYRYEVDNNGADRHLVPVTWYPKPIPFGKANKYTELTQAQGEAMAEVIQRETRVFILGKLPHAYNRFARWKWLIVGMASTMGVIRLLESVLRH